MFTKTLRRLSLLNSVVFLLIFMVFGSVLYEYVSYRLYDKIDDSMYFKAENVRVANGRFVSPGRSRFLFDPRILIFLRDAQGTVITMFPTEDQEISRLTEIAAQVQNGEIQNKLIENHAYRSISLAYPYPDNILHTDRGPFVIKDVIAVSIVDSEVALLSNLLVIIVSGLIIGMLSIILAGYYLARRAMVPIQSSWEKQQEFVADASHELRNPLAVIKSNAELVLRHPGHTIEEESIRVTNIVRESRRMTKLISHLLTLARSDANQSELQLAVVSVNELIDTIAEQFGPLAELEGLTLSAQIDEPLELVADRERLFQLLVILLDNAIKYTTAPGQISITGCKQGSNVLIVIEDSGQGIPPEDLTRVFDRFYRGDKARSREKGGTGLGLAIAKWIVEKHGGKVAVESTVGVGTKFSLLLPSKILKK